MPSQFLGLPASGTLTASSAGSQPRRPIRLKAAKYPISPTVVPRDDFLLRLQKDLARSSIQAVILSTNLSEMLTRGHFRCSHATSGSRSMSLSTVIG
jgi:hypothetical protein